MFGLSDVCLYIYVHIYIYKQTLDLSGLDGLITLICSFPFSCSWYEMRIYARKRPIPLQTADTN